MPTLPEKDTFYQLLDELLSTGKPIYESTFDAFLNTHYGAITDEYPETSVVFTADLSKSAY